MSRREKSSPLRWSLSDLLTISGRRIATVALVLLSASIAVNFGELIVRGAEIQQEVAQQRAVNVAHEAELHHLKALLGYYQSSVHVEMVAREQLGYAREGDTVILPSMLIPEPAEQPAPPEAIPAPPPTPNWVLWWSAFFPARS